MIDAGVVVGADTVIEPFVQLLGETKVGKECRIRSYSVLEHATLGNRVLIRNGCIISQARVDDGALLAPMRISGRRARSGKTRMWATLSKPRRFAWAKGPRRII